MAKHRYTVEISGTVTMDVDDSVFDAVTDEWRRTFYPLHTREQIVEHLAYNRVANGWGLGDLDGFANLDRDAATIDDVEIECDAKRLP